MKITFSSASLLVILAAFLSGCVSNNTARYTPLPTTAADRSGGPTAQPAFSDEQSRDLIRQTRELLALKEQDYLVGPDDVLEIKIFEWQAQDSSDSLELRVSKTGLIAMPGLGPIQVGGLTVEQIQTGIVSQLAESNLLPNARVSIRIKEFRSRRISVVGSVVAPGVYALTENVASLLEILSLAGGPTASAGNTAYILRKQDDNPEPLKIAVDLDELYKTGSSDLDAVLTDGDTVFVPQAPHVVVYGEVTRPGRVPIRRTLTLMEALAEAGGLSRDAVKDKVRIDRQGGPGKRNQTFYVNVKRLEGGGGKDIVLEERDVIKVATNDGKRTFLGITDFIRGIFSASYRLDN